MDLSKAFDTIDHHILLKNLQSCRIRGLPLKWFENYLTNRKQYVVVDGIASTQSNVTYGIPQGSVLGPLLFLLYINDIISCSSLLQFSLFADDTAALVSGTDIDALIQIVNFEIQKLNVWFQSNKLSLNFKKTKYIIFHSRNRRVPNTDDIHIEENVLERVPNISFLGVIMDECMNWNAHILSIKSKIARSIGIISRYKDFLPEKTLLTLYNTLVYPHLLYCNLAWGNTYRTKLYPLYLLQKRAIRIITHSTFQAHTKPLFTRLKCLNLYDLILLDTWVLMFKCMNNLAPCSFSAIFTKTANVHTYNTRQSQHLYQPLARTTVLLNSFYFKGITEWNSLDPDIKLSSTLSKFKQLSKHKLLTRFTQNYN